MIKAYLHAVGFGVLFWCAVLVCCFGMLEHNGCRRAGQEDDQDQGLPGLC